MIPKPIQAEILARIARAEQEHKVKVLYAVESGSRAWGFASPNSDYDVRFVYAHPQEWYLTIDVEDKRDVIEYAIVGEIDINGWDIRKALKLLWRSNPAIMEWLYLPIVYVDDGAFARAARALAPDVYSIEKGIYHYRSMAQTNYRDFLKAELVPIKKYFYVLRALLSTKWLARFNEPAPIEFHKLRELVRDNHLIDNAISALLKRKSLSEEKEFAPPIKILNQFIEAELAQLEQAAAGGQPTADKDIQDLNALFAKILW